MSNKTKLTPIAAALGTTFAVSLMASPIANAAENPFEINELSSGYMQLADGHGEGEGEGEGEGGCGEGQCGGEGEGEGSCGEGSCGEGKGEGEGSCGEGSCGEGGDGDSSSS